MSIAPSCQVREDPEGAFAAIAELVASPAGRLQPHDFGRVRRRYVRRQLACQEPVVFDFSAIKTTGRRRLRRLLVYVRNHMRDLIPEDTTAEVILIGLSDESQAALRKTLEDPLRGVELVTQEHTLASTAVRLRILPWVRDPAKGRMLRALIARDGAQCAWCSTELAVDDRRATVDHVIPRVEGGANSLDNLILACVNCNQKRGHLSAADWLASCLAHTHRQPQIAVIEAALARAALAPLVAVELAQELVLGLG